jgi:hypothetical protein
MKKHPTYVVPMDAMVEEIRLAAVEESQVLSLIYPSDPVFKPGEIVTAGKFQDQWIRRAMDDPHVRSLVMHLEQALFARLLQDVYLVSTLNVARINLDAFRNRLKRDHQVDDELLFRQVFGGYMKFSHVPSDVKLGYDGLSLYLQAV